MKNILFVCLGNICRSPAAEGVLKKLLVDHSIENKFLVDSAGTSSFHAGQPPDQRMSYHASLRGYNLGGQSRPFVQDDFERFDLICTMDNSNFLNVSDMARSRAEKDKIKPFTSFCTIHNITQVPDPYTSGSEGFELVMDIVEDGCQGIVKMLADEM